MYFDLLRPPLGCTLSPSFPTTILFLLSIPFLHVHLTFPHLQLAPADVDAVLYSLTIGWLFWQLLLFLSTLPVLLRIHSLLPSSPFFFPSNPIMHFQDDACNVGVALPFCFYSSGFTLQAPPIPS